MFSYPNFKNIDNSCRTCLNSSGVMYDIFAYRVDSLLSDILTNCTNLKVDHHDGLPKKLCSSCYNCLVSFYDFRRQAERIDQDLKNHLQNTVRLQKDIFTSIDIKPENDDDTNDFDRDYKELINLNEDAQYMAAENDLCLKVSSNFCDDQYFSNFHHIRHKDPDGTKYYCNVCQKSFRKLEKFRLHLSKHKNKIYDCGFCLKTFSNKHKFLKHLDEHGPHETERFVEIDQNNENQRLKCDICSEMFLTIDSLSDHMQSHTEKESTKRDIILSCSHCGEVFKRVSELVQHESIKHFNQNALKKSEVFSEIRQNDVSHDVECEVCSAKFKSINSLSAHKRVHTEKGRILSCSSCGKVFKKINHLKRHELTHDVNRPFKCNLCPKSFLNDSMLKEHLNLHSGLKPHCCPLCSKSFAFLSTLKKHTKSHINERVYMCSTCGKTFDSSSNLNQHTKRHIGLKSFSCTLCPRSFVSKGELKSHTISHTGERAYSCDECGATFTKRYSLSKHMLTHLGIRPHKCDACCMRFASKDHLKRHIRIHTGEKPYRCDMCERAFTQSNDLVKHRRAHLGDKLYRCSECSESFRLKTELRQHISEHFISSRLQALNVNKIVENPSQNIENLGQINIPPGDGKKFDIGVDLMDNVNIMLNNSSNVVENPNNIEANALKSAILNDNVKQV